MSPRPDLGPKPRLGYTHSRSERTAERRPDVKAIAALAAQPSASAYVIGGDLIVMKKGAILNDPLFSMNEARALGPTSETVFLGLLDGAARFGYGIAPAVAEALKTRDGFHVTDLRSIAVQGLVEPDHLPPIERPRRCCIGTPGIAFAQTAGTRHSRCRQAGSAIARNARPSIFRVPTRW